MMRVYIYLIFILLIVPGMSAGQSITDMLHIREVRVLAKRKVEEAGLKITRPDSMQLISYLTADLSALLEGQSTVFIKSYGRGSEATASFRGTAATHTQILWNGMNLNSPMRGVADLSMFPLYFTDEVYLLHGGSSMTRGSGALGGSIHLDNTPEWRSGWDLEGLVERGSFHSQKSFIKIRTGGRQLQSSTRLFYDASKNDFSFYNTGVIPKQMDTQKGAAYRKAGVLQEIYLRRFSDRMSGFRVWVQQGERDLPQLMSYQGTERDEYQKDLQVRAQFDWKRYSETVNYQFFSGINTTRLDYYRATPAFGYVNEDSRSVETGFLNHLRLFRKFDDKTYATVTLNANYFQVEAIDHLMEGGYKNDRSETSLLMNLHLKPSDRLAAFLLIRSENYDKQLVPFIPSAGIEWQPFLRMPVMVRSNLARNYHKPTLNDLYWLPGGNPGLLPEDGYTGDLSVGADLFLRNFVLKSELTGFVSKIENWIVWRPAINGAYYWEAANLKDVLSRGVEFQYRLSYENQKFDFHSGGSYAYTATSNLHAARPVDASRGKQLIYIPKHQGGFFLSAGLKKFTLKYDLTATGKRYTNSSNEESDFERVLNGYWLSDISLSKQIQYGDLSWMVKISVENLFDQDYQSILWRPMPGRFYSFSVAFKFRSS